MTFYPYLFELVDSIIKNSVLSLEPIFSYKVKYRGFHPLGFKNARMRKYKNKRSILANPTFKVKKRNIFVHFMTTYKALSEAAENSLAP